MTHFHILSRNYCLGNIIKTALPLSTPTCSFSSWLWWIWDRFLFIVLVPTENDFFLTGDCITCLTGSLYFLSLRILLSFSGIVMVSLIRQVSFLWWFLAKITYVFLLCILYRQNDFLIFYICIAIINWCQMFHIRLFLIWRYSNSSQKLCQNIILSSRIPIKQRHFYGS